MIAGLITVNAAVGVVAPDPDPTDAPPRAENRDPWTTAITDALDDLRPGSPGPEGETRRDQVAPRRTGGPH